MGLYFIDKIQAIYTSCLQEIAIMANAWDGEDVTQ
jgi:hypothetical protein